MKPLEQRISTHLAAWGNNGGRRGGMEQMTTEFTRPQTEVGGQSIYLLYKRGRQNPAPFTL